MLTNKLGLDVGPKLNTSRELFGSNMQVFPEFYYYGHFIENKKDQATLDKLSTISLLEIDDTSYVTFMNPVNLKYFYDKMKERNYLAIIKRFGLIDFSLVDSMNNYL